MMRMEIYGNMKVDIPPFTDQMWRRDLTDRIMPCIALFLSREERNAGRKQS